MTEARWEIADPQNRIRRLAPVADGTVTVQIVLPSADPATITAVEQAASDAGIDLIRVPAAPAGPVAAARMGYPTQGVEVVVGGVRYIPAPR